MSVHPSDRQGNETPNETIERLREERDAERSRRQAWEQSNDRWKARAERLREALRKVVDRTYMVQYDEGVSPAVVKFASEIHHLALEADTEKNYYAALDHGLRGGTDEGDALMTPLPPESDREGECPMCKGKRTVPSKGGPVPCPTCHGTGKLDREGKVSDKEYDALVDSLVDPSIFVPDREGEK